MIGWQQTINNECSTKTITILRRQVGVVPVVSRLTSCVKRIVERDIGGDWTLVEKFVNKILLIRVEGKYLIDE